MPDSIWMYYIYIISNKSERQHYGIGNPHFREKENKAQRIDISWLTQLVGGDTVST